MIPGQSMTLGVPAVSPNGKAPRCEHFDGLAPVTPAVRRTARDLPGTAQISRHRPDLPSGARGLPYLRLGGLF